MDFYNYELSCHIYMNILDLMSYLMSYMDIRLNIYIYISNIVYLAEELGNEDLLSYTYWR